MNPLPLRPSGNSITFVLWEKSLRKQPFIYWDKRGLLFWLFVCIKRTSEFVLKEVAAPGTGVSAAPMQTLADGCSWAYLVRV